MPSTIRLPAARIIAGHQYELTRLIAAGGMGAVYEAKLHGVEGFEKLVAIKTIIGDFSSDEEFVRLFIGEAKLVADLVHENIVQVYALGRHENMLYIAMEYVDGINLEHYIEEHIRQGWELPVELGAFIASRVCRGLEYAHSKTGRDGQPLGIVHRDISPKNIMITYEGVVKITDFGIAKARRLMEQNEGEVLMGKIEYMSPEQVNYEFTDGRSDLFSLGIVTYEILTGHQLFNHENANQVMSNVRSGEIHSPRSFRPEIPEDLAEILLTGLQRDLDKRYPTAGRMGYALERYMYHNRMGPTNVTLGEYMRSRFGVQRGINREWVPQSDSDQLVKARASTSYRDTDSGRKA
jgi:eukaryotic-like serine/threonine-protein kinase